MINDDFWADPVKVAATETHRHAPLLSAMQSLSTENEALKKEIKLLKAEIERLKKGTLTVTAGPDAEEKARHAEQLKKFIELSSKIDATAIDPELVKKAFRAKLPPPMEDKKLVMGKSGDFVWLDDLEVISGIEAVERGRRAEPNDESAKGFEWEGAWDDDVLPADTTP